MKNLTDEMPKCLVTLNGKALLDWQLGAIAAAGIDEVGIVTGYRREMLGPRFKTEFYNSRWASTNMVASLMCATEWLSRDPCVVSYSDIFYESSAIRSLADSPDELAITYDPNWLELWSKRFDDPLTDAETFIVNSKNYVQKIGNRPVSIGEVMGQYMGLLKFTPASWRELSRIYSAMSRTEADNLHLTGALQRIIADGNISLRAIPYTETWGEIDSEEDLGIYQGPPNPE